MNECYDRSCERLDFDNCNSNVIFFTSANGNGMTTFLYNVLNSKQYIFVKEGDGKEIVFDEMDRSISAYQKRRQSNFKVQRTRLEFDKTFINLFYLIPNLGPILYSLGLNIVNDQIEEINSMEFSFTNFLKTYISFQQNKILSNEAIYLIVDHADRYSNIFLSKLRECLDIGNIKLIICLDVAVIKAEYKKVFNGIKYDIIDFSKPNYKNALIIFENSGMDKRYYNEEMYESSYNIIDFFGKYQTELKNHQENYCDNAETLVHNYILSIPCIYGKEVLKSFCEYLAKNSYVDQCIDLDKIINKLLTDRIISSQGKYYKTISPTLNSENGPVAIGFASYAMSTYKKFNYDFLYFVFKKYKNEDFVDCHFLQYLLENSSNLNEINEIISVIKKRKFSYRCYLIICKTLVDKMLYEFLFSYDGNIQDEWQLFDEFLRLLIKDKKHQKFNRRKYVKLIGKCIEKYDDSDAKSMFAIVFLDYSINHARKNIQQFFKTKSPYYYCNFNSSKYYYILESVVAYYETDNNKALHMYDEAIQITDEPKKIYLLNNKFAYVLSRYINFNSYDNEVKMILENYDLANNCWIENNEFLNTNILLYKSVCTQNSAYDVSSYWDKENLSYKHNLNTWDLYKIINHHILRFAFADDFHIEEFVDLEDLIFESNRSPAKNIFYYNLYLMALYFDNHKYIIRAKRFLDNNRDFKYSNLYETYKNVLVQKRDEVLENKRKYVRFGYIFSRMNFLPYLFNSMAVLIK